MYISTKTRQRERSLLRMRLPDARDFRFVYNTTFTLLIDLLYRNQICINAFGSFVLVMPLGLVY